MMAKLSAAAAVTLAALFVALECGVAGATLIKVGGGPGWVPDTNYTNWASNQQFYVGDWLYFVFNKYQYDVLEVNQTAYESCNIQAGLISNVTNGGRDVFQLTHPGTYYFLCSRGYCWGGMKLAVTVLEATAPAPTPAKSAAASPSFPQHLILLLALAAAALFSSSGASAAALIY